jgi:hypothetical protein
MEAPTDEQLDTWIRARLAVAGIDLEQLHPTQRDPVTGSPSQAELLTSVRGFLRSTPATISDWQVPAPPGPEGDHGRLQQQSAPPVLYPSIATAWTDGAWPQAGVR